MTAEGREGGNLAAPACRHLQPFGTSIFSEMTRLAGEHGAINLSQGFPDFEGPPGIIAAAAAAMRAGHNQYARSMGHPQLVEAIACKLRDCYRLEYDPYREIVVTSGATEAIAAAFLGLLNPGDEVLLIEPFYDSYPACTAMAGATPHYLTLRFPHFALDPQALAALSGARPRLLVLNNPHNPTGRVFTREELGHIARWCVARDVLVLADEVYEHLTYDGAEHVPIASLPGMRERTLTVSSTGKTFSLTGWKIGWAYGPAPLVAALQAAHQFITFSTATPLQVAMAEALRTHAGEYLAELRSGYAARRDFIVAALRDSGFEVAVPRGTYFAIADFSRLFAGDDRQFARFLVERHRVAAVPPSVFYAGDPEAGRRLIRFAFSKRMETLEAAAERLRGLKTS
jgi:N-succinyldiaminopimelate aminotransferase